MNKLKICQKLALAAVTMLSLSLDETACPRSITESTHWRATPLTHTLLTDVLRCMPLNKSKRLLLPLNVILYTSAYQLVISSPLIHALM